MKVILVSMCLLTVTVLAAEPPPIPATPAPVDSVVYARTFTLEQGYQSIASKERPWVTTGTLLVLKVDKAFVYPREIAMPVLYVGDKPAERLNRGNESGYLVVIVPGELDLNKALVWFGAPNFPHMVDAATAQQQLALANSAGIKPFTNEQIKAALSAGGPTLNTSDKSALLRSEVAELILKYSPQEKQLADGFRLPVVQKPAQPGPAEESKRP